MPVSHLTHLSNTHFPHPHTSVGSSHLPQLCHQDLVCLYTSPHLFPRRFPPGLLLQSTMPLSSLHPLPTLTLQRFDTPALKICGYQNQVLMHGGFSLKLTCLQVSTAPQVCFLSLAPTLLSMLSFMPFLSLFFLLSPSATFLEVSLLKICFFSEGFHH